MLNKMLKIEPKNAESRVKFLSLKIKNMTKYLQSFLAFS